MGRANHHWAQIVCRGLVDPKSKNLNPKYQITGNPIRNTVTEGSKEKGYALTGFTGERPVLLVMGGSQGAQAINDAIFALLPDLLETYDVIHITGRNKEIQLSSFDCAQDDNLIGNHYWSAEFITLELPDLYAITDLAVSRAGAGSIAELSANQIPAIYVPLRDVPHAHQEDNANIAQQQSLGKMLYQEKLTNQLIDALAEIVHCPLSIVHSQESSESHTIAQIISDSLA